MLNERQKLAVETKARNIEVIAGAGTGKTTVIAEKVKYLVNELKVKPSEILCISFTVKAVEEMAERVGIDGVEFKTLHALGLQILKSVSGYVRVISKDTEDVDVIAIKKQDSRAVELSELVENAVERLELKRAVKDLRKDDKRQYWENRFKYILVDEAQDLNFEQFNLLKILGQRNSVFIVGDPLQSIYLWRGSDPEVFNRFVLEFDAVETITLNENYRSTQQILDRASRFYEFENERLDRGNGKFYKQSEPLKAVSSYSGYVQEDFKIERFGTEAEQLKWISETIKQNGIKDYLILGRTHKALEYLKQNFKDPERVMTLHKAKGLEAETVFIVGFTAPILPQETESLTRTQAFEETRVCYVGLTRAKRDLYLSFIGRKSRLSYWSVQENDS